ncbi:SMI1/KNR4 family protein [Actinomadura sp. 9N407]|uniref:SMI1/KNR4 family protein n=1 Tax=Actinomadura sp. 9N407 TaxID=3375154 RepID=UPI0037A100A8
MTPFEQVKASFWGSGTDGVQPPLTEYLVQEAERHLGVALPAELLELLRIRNGGPVSDRWDAFPTSQPTFWAVDHVPFTDLFGIGRAEHTVALLDTPYLVKEWGLPPGLVLLSGDGHCWIALDYRAHHQPHVTWIDNEMKSELHLATDFRAFIEGLQPADNLSRPGE